MRRLWERAKARVLGPTTADVIRHEAGVFAARCRAARAWSDHDIARSAPVMLDCGHVVNVIHTAGAGAPAPMTKRCPACIVAECDTGTNGSQTIDKRAAK